MASEKNFQKKHLGQEQHFSKLRAVFFPIHGYELKKFLPLAFMFLFVIFNFWTLKNVKDTLIVTAYGSGAETLSFLKIWAVLPAALIFLVGYMYLVNKFSFEKIFIGTVIFFAAFFLIFALYIYPNRDSLQISAHTLEILKDKYPRVQWFIPLYGYWVYTLFYVLAELWGSIVLTLLFWQFSNQICRVFEARRFYTMINLIGSSLGQIIAGRVTKELCGNAEDMEGLSVVACEQMWSSILQNLMFMVGFSCLFIMGIFWWMNRQVLTDAIHYDDFKAQQSKEQKPQVKLSFKDSIKYIISSKYIGYMALITIGFNLTINILEISWKAQLKQLYSTQIGYSGFTAGVVEMAGWVTFVVTLIAATVIRKSSWLTSAVITPILMFITGGLFFVVLLGGDYLKGLMVIFGTTPLLFSVWVGSLQQMSLKATKYSFFNTTREMAYIPLDPELRTKGKAAVDVVGERLGKSGGAFTIQILLMATSGTMIDVAPYLSIVLFIAIAGWLWGVFALNKLFIKLTQKSGVDFTKGSED
jgi:ATP:ADP antiporter, AAA family